MPASARPSTATPWNARQPGSQTTARRSPQNKAGFVPRLVNRCPVKSINQFSTKRKAESRQKLGKLGTTGTTEQMGRLTAHHTWQIAHYLHTASRRIIDVLVAEGIGRVCIGKNPLWKQDIHMGRRNNQDVVQVPHARFIELLAYKAELVGIQLGIQVCVTEETARARPASSMRTPCRSTARRIVRLQWQAREARALSSHHWASHQCRCERRVQHTIRKVLPDSLARGQGIAALNSNGAFRATIRPSFPSHARHTHIIPMVPAGCQFHRDWQVGAWVV